MISFIQSLSVPIYLRNGDMHSIYQGDEPSPIFGRNEEEAGIIRESGGTLRRRVGDYGSRIKTLEGILHRGWPGDGHIYQPSQVASVSALKAQLAAEEELTFQLQRDVSQGDPAKAMTSRVLQAEEINRGPVENQQQITVVRTGIIGNTIEDLLRKLDEAYKKTRQARNEEMSKRIVAEERIKGLERELALMSAELGELKVLCGDQTEKNMKPEDRLKHTRRGSNVDPEDPREELQAQKRLAEAQIYPTRNEKSAQTESQESQESVSLIRKKERYYKQLERSCRAYKEKYSKSRDEANEKITYKSFKPGDLALFLKTRNITTRPWAAFNVNAPYYFLKEEPSVKYAGKEWLLARIVRVQERLVDLSRQAAMPTHPPASPSVCDSCPGDGSLSTTLLDEENPFELPDGTRWYLLEVSLDYE